MSFEIGELVLLTADYLTLDSAKAAKLKPKYFGPFKVLEKERTAYKLELTKDMKQIHPVFHQSQLKKYHGSQTPVSETPDEEVEKIYGHKYARGGGRLYYVKFTNLPMTDLRFIEEKDVPAELLTTYKAEQELE